jgi:NTE family protein
MPGNTMRVSSTGLIRGALRWRRSKALSLALQGGGAHGAFTWGVLDRFLEEESIEIAAISATSSGAMNAVMLAQGITSGGRDTARQTLARFLGRVADHAPVDPTVGHLLSLLNNGTPEMPSWLEPYLNLARAVSPYQMNPLGFNPLRAMLSELVDFEQLRQHCPIKLFIAATRVRSGVIRIFTNQELSVEALLASACLPSLHPPVEIDGEVYWDGGFSGNPPVFPLIFEGGHKDILLVLLYPPDRPDAPLTVKAIAQRSMEFNLSAGFLQEMRTIAEIRARAGQGLLPLGHLGRRFQKLRFHLIEEDEWMPQLSHASKFNVERSFLARLHAQGRRHADRWLQQHFPALGRRSTIDINLRFS